MSAVPSTPSESSLEAGGHVKGLALAIVRQNKDSSGQVNLRVSFPWHSQPRQSYPARLATPMAGKKRGIYFVPEVDDEVLVGFEKGDLGHPYILGSLWNGVDASPATNADGKNDQRLIHTRKGHKLTFDDGSKGRVQLELSDGKKLSLDDQGVTLEDEQGNRLHIETGSGAITLEAKSSLTLKAPSIKLDATGTLDLKAGGAVTMSGLPVKIN